MAKQPEPRGTPAGNKTNLTDDQEQGLFAQNKTKYLRLLDTFKKAQKALTDHGKIIKAEHGEHGLLMIKTSIALQDAASADEAKGKADAIVKVMRWHGEPVSVQGSLFEQNDGDMTVEERAYAAGRRAGLAGEAMTAPVEYAAGDAFQEWAKGWHNGQESIFAIKAPSATVN